MPEALDNPRSGQGILLSPKKYELRFFDAFLEIE